MPEDGAIHVSGDMGNVEHRRLLRAMAAYIARQSWALAFVVFGSVARGNWHDLSDLDLDVVVTPEARLFAAEEAERMLAEISEPAALVAPRSQDAAEVVLESLAQFSIRYHTLPQTSPNILESARVIWGDLTVADLTLNAERPYPEPGPETYDLVSLAIRALLYGQIGLARGHLWSALSSLTEAREYLLDLYGEARGLPRPLPDFDERAPKRVRDALALLVPVFTPESIREALLAGCDLMESDALAPLALDQVELADGGRRVLAALRDRLMNTSMERE